VTPRSGQVIGQEVTSIHLLRKELMEDDGILQAQAWAIIFLGCVVMSGGGRPTGSNKVLFADHTMARQWDTRRTFVGGWKDGSACGITLRRRITIIAS
jgi:hypothetical protein